VTSASVPNGDSIDYVYQRQQSTNTAVFLAGTIQFSCGQTWRLIGNSGTQNELQDCWYHTPNG
jgi:hypothetical protein